jgi:hypothetical protein
MKNALCRQGARLPRVNGHQDLVAVNATSLGEARRRIDQSIAGQQREMQTRRLE